MPIYAYRCTNCGFTMDVMRKMSDPVLSTCPECKTESFAKQLTAPSFHLKGSGWYATDFKGGKKSSETESEVKSEVKSEANTEAKGEAKTEGKTEGKTEAKSEAKTEGKTEAKTETKTENQSPRNRTRTSAGKSNQIKTHLVSVG